MPSILTAAAFLAFLEADSHVRVYPNTPQVLYSMSNSEFPIIKTVVIPNRHLLVHVTGPPHHEGLL